MAHVRLCSIAPGQDLTQLAARLAEKGVDHTWEPYEQGTYLVIDDRHLTAAVAVLESLKAAPIHDGREVRTKAWRRAIQLWPVTLIAVLLGLLGYGAVIFEAKLGVLRYLTFFALDAEGPHSLYETYLVQQQWWRLWAPTFLHFGLLHITFNGLAIWELGRRVELCLGPMPYALCLALMAAVANLVQYLLSGPALFGGLSGAVFGLLGMVAVLYLRGRLLLFRLPVGVYVLASVSLLAGPLGLFERFFGIAIADGAHFGGLAVGVLLGLLIPGRFLKGRAS